MQALPIFFNIKNRHCVVIGGGDVATRKINMLLKADADVTVVSPSLVEAIQVLLEDGKVKVIKADYEKNQLIGA